LTDDFLSRLDKSVDRYKRAVQIAIKLTNGNDWVSQDGHPYLQATGAEKIKNPFGVNIVDITSRRIANKDQRGDSYIWEYKGKAFSSKLGGSFIECIGVCSSRDKFFARVAGELKSIEDVDEVRIMQKAYNNLIVNAVKRVLGLRSLTWEDLKGAGIGEGSVGKVTYAKTGAGGGKISKPQANRLWAILQNGATNDEIRTFREGELKKYISSNYKIEHSAEIDRKNYDDIVKKAEEIAKQVTVGS
jgi:hypothetical protein